MKIYSYPTLSDVDNCPYIDGNEAQYLYFFAEDLDEKEWEYFLAQGFRKFGQYFFKPQCPSCNKCQPIRVLAKEFKASKSQRRVLNKNKNTQMSTHSLLFHQDIYDLYVSHSQAKFDTQKYPIPTKEEFIQSHFTRTTPALMTQYKVDNHLVAVGFLDVSHMGLSSVYFIYHPDYSHLSLGTFGALKEIELAQEMDKSFYYLGFFIEENKSMNYKSQFSPYEILGNGHWNQKK